MKSLFIIYTMLLFSASSQLKQAKPTIISLNYQQKDIQLQFDTLFNHQQTDSGVYKGFIEQALANCHRKTDSTSTITQDVFSSMYLNFTSGQYDCVTTTVFKFPDGTISATGVLSRPPGDTIAPDHDFPITDGSAAYKNISGTYTRKYKDGAYYVELQYYKLEQENQ
ncbi:hypothetical protein SAMN05518672_103670 [Chitinophaga sp. CF118]|uniref:hypothetical protein n=1 Tax=Chitinophaga sp. CF118 TaxID=1884367 RepID=UPI0008E13037|nr:hypothetical protein [Chitinophaga sp. CF118]SFD88183.1 hypothetical protein SAMN05518672_103670 [Chitinophaga sp. CF118]